MKTADLHALILARAATPRLRGELIARVAPSAHDVGRDRIGREIDVLVADGRLVAEGAMLRARTVAVTVTATAWTPPAVLPPHPLRLGVAPAPDVEPLAPDPVAAPDPHAAAEPAGDTSPVPPGEERATPDEGAVGSARASWGSLRRQLVRLVSERPGLRPCEYARLARCGVQSATITLRRARQLGLVRAEGRSSSCRYYPADTVDAQPSSGEGGGTALARACAPEPGPTGDRQPEHEGASPSPAPHAPTARRPAAPSAPDPAPPRPDRRGRTDPAQAVGSGPEEEEEKGPEQAVAAYLDDLDGEPGRHRAWALRALWRQLQEVEERAARIRAAIEEVRRLEVERG